MRFQLGLASVLLFAGVVTRLVTAEEPAEKILATALDPARQHSRGEVLDLLSQALKKEPDLAIGYYHRGRANFVLGKVPEAVADFDKYVALRPQAEASQWERGIAYFYAGEYAKGAKQFELYQTYHDQDVENATWRYLCLVPTEGVEKAQQTMLPIDRDPRVPMAEIYDLYRGKVEPAAVLAATKELNKEAKHTAEFYAHLYLGLWYGAAGKKQLEREHIFAAEARPIGHYMHDVARVHAERLRQGEQPSPTK